MHGKEDTCDLEFVDLYSQVGVFSQVSKDWEMSLEVVGGEFFSFFSKITDWEGLLDTLGDAHRPKRRHIRASPRAFISLSKLSFGELFA